MPKYYLSSSLGRKNLNFNIQSRATIVAQVPWRNFFLYAHKG
jgi:hypothetical protein